MTGDSPFMCFLNLINHWIDCQPSQLLDVWMERDHGSHRATQQADGVNETNDKYDDVVNKNWNSLYYVCNDLDDHITWIDNFYASNEDVEFEDPLPYDIENVVMFHVSRV